MDRVIFHCDLNCFYASVELLSHPELREVPVAVAGDPASRHGIILAKNEPAKQCGVKTAETIWQAKKKCPNLVLLPAHHKLYREYSNKVNAIYDEYTDLAESFGIDESWLDVTNTLHLFGGDAKALANAIRQRVKRELGLTLSVGVSFNKVFAKLGSDYKKPDATTVISRENWRSIVWPLPVGDLLYVGGAVQKLLGQYGVKTIGQLAACNVELLKPILGEKYAIQIHDYACGIDPSPVVEREPINKGYGNSTTLSRDVDDLDTAFTVLLSLCETVGARLRADHVICDCVCVEIKDWDFHVQSHQTTLNSPTDSTTVLYENACRLLKEFWDRTPLRLIGVRATKISDDEFSQISLFESEQSKKMKEMEKAVDQIRSKFGTDIIKRASFLKKDSIVDHAASKQKHLSHSALKEDEKGSEGGGSGKVRDYKRGWNETY